MANLEASIRVIEGLDAEYVVDEGHVAAAAFLARYGGRTFDAYRHDLRSYLQRAGRVGMGLK